MPCPASLPAELHHLAAAAGGGQQFLRRGGQQDDADAFGRLFQRLEQCVLGGHAHQFGLADDEDPPASAGAGAIGRRQQELADDLDAQVLHHPFSHVGIVVEAGQLAVDDQQVGVGAGLGRAAGGALIAGQQQGELVGQIAQTAGVGLPPRVRAEQQPRQRLGRGPPSHPLRPQEQERLRASPALQRPLKLRQRAVLADNLQQAAHGLPMPSRVAASLSSSASTEPKTVCLSAPAST